MNTKRTLICLMIPVVLFSMTAVVNVGEVLMASEKGPHARKEGPFGGGAGLGGGYPSSYVPPDPLVQARLSTRPVWKDFRNRYPGAWSAQWNEDTGTPRNAYGPGIPMAIGSFDTETLEVLARQFVDENHELFGLNSNNLELTHSADARNVWSIQFKQVNNGVPVHRSMVHFRFHKTGAISLFGSKNVIPNLSLETRPLVGVGEAIRLARESAAVLGLLKDSPEPELVIHSEKGIPTLAWKVTVPARDPQALWRVLINARSGKTILVWDDLMHTDVSGNASGDGWLGSPPPCNGIGNYPLQDLEVRVVGGNSAITDTLGDFVISNSGSSDVTVEADLSGPWAHVHNSAGPELTFSQVVTPGVPASVVFNGGGTAEHDLAQVTAFQGVSFIHDYIKDISPGATGIDLQLPTNVNISSTCNANYDFTAINFFSSGGGCANTAFDSVIYHEYGHFYDDMMGGIADGSLSEGTGDVCSVLPLENPIIGECFRDDGTYVRNADNDIQWPNCSGVHACGEIFVGFVWDARLNLIASLGHASGQALIEDIAFNAITSNPSDIPDAVLEFFIQDDDDGAVSNGTPHYGELCSAAQDHSFDCPEIISPVTIFHSPLENTPDSVNPYTVTATIFSTEGAIVSKDLFYRLDAGSWVSVPMTATGNPDEYSASIPTQPCPTDVDYYITATDDGAETNTEPVGAPGASHSFKVIETINIFFDDFEGVDDNGWTHGGSQDDWERGAPQGKANDPSAAYSGSNCWGNDLGDGSSDGEYESSADNYLLSPVIDATVFSDVFLTFRRKLSIESSTYDHARVLVNGVQVWENTGGNFADSGWTLQTIDVSSIAGNNPSVQIRFELDSDSSVEFGGWNLDDVGLIVEGCFEGTFSTARFTDAAGTDMVLYDSGTSLVYVTVSDPDENENPSLAETVQATVATGATGDSETIVLTETGVNTGEFRNSTGVTATCGAGTPGNGILEVSESFTSSVTYEDDDNSYDISIDSASFLCAPAAAGLSTEITLLQSTAITKSKLEFQVTYSNVAGQVLGDNETLDPTLRVALFNGKIAPTDYSSLLPPIPQLAEGGTYTTPLISVTVPKTSTGILQAIINKHIRLRSGASVGAVEDVGARDWTPFRITEPSRFLNYFVIQNDESVDTNETDGFGGIDPFEDEEDEDNNTGNEGFFAVSTPNVGGEAIGTALTLPSRVGPNATVTAATISAADFGGGGSATVGVYRTDAFGEADLLSPLYGPATFTPPAANSVNGGDHLSTLIFSPFSVVGDETIHLVYFFSDGANHGLGIDNPSGAEGGPNAVNYERTFGSTTSYDPAGLYLVPGNWITKLHVQDDSLPFPSGGDAVNAPGWSHFQRLSGNTAGTGPLTRLDR